MFYLIQREVYSFYSVLALLSRVITIINNEVLDSYFRGQKNIRRINIIIMDALRKALTVTLVCIMSKEPSMLSPLQTRLPSKTGRERNTDGHTNGWEIISETQQTYHEKAAPIEFSHERTSHAKYLFFLFSGSAMTTTHN